MMEVQKNGKALYISALQGCILPIHIDVQDKNHKRLILARENCDQAIDGALGEEGEREGEGNSGILLTRM